MAHGRSLRGRVAGQSAMRDAVEARKAAGPRSRFARMAGVSPLDAAGRRAYRAALGELVVGDILDGLGQRWDVLHDLPLGDDLTLEHLVMGPAGVFAVKTANHADVDVVVVDDVLTAAGEPQDDIPMCKRQADAASEALGRAAGEPVPVRPLLVVVAPRRLTVRREPSDVIVVASSGVERVLSRAPRNLDGDAVARISDLAEREATWPAASELTLDTQRLNREFAAVRAEMRSALRTGVAWLVGGILVAAVSVWLLIAALVHLMVAG